MPRNPSCRRSTIALVLLFAAFALAACTRGNGTHAPANHTVLISGFKYQPDTLTVQAGDTIEWKNSDVVPHTVTAADQTFDSGSIPADGSWKFVARTKGTYPYICTFHPNMKATLIVQ